MEQDVKCPKCESSDMMSAGEFFVCKDCRFTFEVQGKPVRDLFKIYDFFSYRHRVVGYRFSVVGCRTYV